MIAAFSLLLILMAAITYLTSEIGWSNITLAKRNDIVFENKNQKYGAYSIRAAYNDHMLIALGIMFLVVMAFISGNLIWKNLFKEKQVAEIKQTYTTTLIDVSTEIPEIPKQTQEAQKQDLEKTTSATDKWTTIEITKDITENPPAQGNIVGVGVLKQDGTAPSGPVIVEGPAAPGPDPAAVFDIPETPPMFPNGEAAMMDYLSRNIRYPEMEKENGIDGIVYLSFVVSSTGEITNVQELRGVKGGKGLSREAIRVISAMPKWIPGKMGGRAVNVRFNLPVRFVLN